MFLELQCKQYAGHAHIIIVIALLLTVYLYIMCEPPFTVAYYNVIMDKSIIKILFFVNTIVVYQLYFY